MSSAAVAIALSHRSVAYAHIGVASPNASAANNAAAVDAPSANAIQNSVTPAIAAGRLDVVTVAMYASTRVPRREPVSMCAAASTGRAATTGTTAASCCPGALSE